MSATLRTVPLVFLLLVSAAPAAVPQTAQRDGIQILEMDPPSPATLHNGDHVYLHIRSQSRTPLAIHVRPYFKGSLVRFARLNGEPLLPPGGDAILWFTFPRAAEVDSVHVSASAPRHTAEVAAQDAGVRYIWDGRASPGETRAAWVGPLLEEDDRRLKSAFDQMEQNAKARSVFPFMGMFMAAFSVIALSSLAGVMGWPLWGVVKWRGGWRIAAAVPFTVIAGWTVMDTVDLIRDPTSHNLLPFEFIEAAIVVVPYMLVATLWRASAIKKQTSG